jgi:RNA polymerase sigma-70 factor, ECF subfamily
VTPATSLTVLQRIARGDAAAVQECIDVYGPLVWSLGRRLAPRGADLEDVVQEIFVALWRSAAQFDPGLARESVWVTTVARRKWIDARRRYRRAEGDEALEGLPASGRAESEQIEQADEARHAAEALEQLRPEQRSVLQLAVLSGHTYEQIAARLGLPLGTVKTHARRGLARVREILARGPQGARA